MPFKRLTAAFALAAGLATLTASDSAAGPSQRPDPGQHITTHGTPFIVPGHRSFCRRHADECAPRDEPAVAVRATPAIMRQLDRINSRVNDRITYRLDSEHYGREDYWTYPRNNIGDCEDYALTKRRELIAAGWPPSALLMATAIAESGEGHAVLIARTTQGDYVLDNRYAAPMPWRALPYKWVALQNPRNPSAMNAINNGRGLLDVFGLH